MKSFKDNNGREWLLAIDVNVAKRVRDLAKFDLLSLEIEKLSADAVTLVDVLFAVCKPQADAAKITDEQFAAAIVGDVVADAADALMEAIADFFPKSRRNLLMSVVEKTRAAERAAIPMLQQEIDKVDVEKTLRDLLTPSAAGSSSIPSPA